MLLDCVYKCMQVVGVNSLDLKYPFHRYLREASVFPVYHAGNFGMQRRRVHGVMADPGYDPRARLCQVYVLGTRNGCIRYTDLAGFRPLIST